MFTQLVWWTAIGLEILLLARAARERLVRRFPTFYSYVACVLSVDLIRFYCHRMHPESYQKFYWYTEFLTILVGYAVLFEVYRRSLTNHPGLASLAQKLILSVLVLTVANVVLNTLNSPLGSWVYAIAKLGRDLRYVEATLLVVILGLFSHYRVPAGRNLKGVLFGYVFFIAISVVNLTFLSSPGRGFSLPVRQLPSVGYLVTLTIWCAALWSSTPEPVPPAESQIERDYRILATHTRTMLARAFTSLGRAVRP